MAQGLKRASQAAARTRWDGTLSPEMKRFLQALEPFTEPQLRGKVGGAVTRVDDRARQKCKHLGLVGFDQRSDGKWGWQITEAGRHALKDA